jgi:cold shock CspA family protein
MKVPPEITYRNVPKSESIDSLIREKIQKIEKLCGHVMSCRVAVEKPHEHQQTGRSYRVRIEVSVPPGHDLVVKKKSTGGDIHEALTTVIRNAFDAVFRQVKKLNEIQQGKTKVHPQQEVSAFVSRLFKEEGYGFIRTVNEQEVYFHKNSLVNDDFDDLEVGDGVRFTEEMGEKGPQATTVQLLEKYPSA